MDTSSKAPAPEPPPPARTTIRSYGLALVATTASIALTRLTWPLFSGTPFIPLFGAVVVATHWGNAPAGLVAIVLTLLGAPLAFPATAPSPWDLRTLVMFALTAGVANRVVAGRNRAEAALRASAAELRATWEHAPLGTAQLNPVGEIQRVNPALERLLGYSSSSCAGMPFAAFNDPDDADAERQRFADLVGGADAFYQREQRYRRRDGTLLWGRVTVSAIREPGGSATGALAVLEDITAERQAELDLRASEERLRQAQKMEAVGRLVAGVAHNFNNLLAVTMGYTDLVLARQGDEGIDRGDLQEIRKATERGVALTRQLLAFGRKHDAKMARVDLTRTVVGIREMLTPVLREDIQLTIDVPPDPLSIVIDPHDLEQAILNLVINARDALPAGGAIHIDVAREQVAPANSQPGLAVTPSEYARVRVRDNGTGMSSEVQSHLFEPFFTTKDVGKGTGLGLAFVHGIARHGGGFVSIDSAPAQGTTVSVFLPLAAQAATDAVAAIPPRPVARPTAGGTILLVEDEAAVSTMIALMLSRAGYRVLAAATPGEACALFERHAADIDLLLTDVVMPEMNGPALAQRLITLQPDLRVLFVSGYSDVMPAGATASRRMAYLAKPFSSHHLVTAVEGLLAPRTI